MSEHSSFFLDQDDPRLLQEHCLQLTALEHVDRICRDHGLRYFLVFGTLLGAVRHQGFIPWDDDLDIAMPRDDYEQFCKLANRQLDPAKYFLQSEWTDPLYPNTFAKIRCNNTLVQEHASIKGLHHEGVYIDIFPLDHAPDSYPARKLREWRYLFYHLSIRTKIQGYKAERWQSRVATHFGSKLNLEWLRKKRRHVMFGRQDKFLQSGTLAAYPASASEVQTGFIDQKPFEEAGELIFCELPVSVPGDYDSHLREVFGDYMTPPDPDKRRGHYVREVCIDTEFWHDEIVSAWPRVSNGLPLPPEFRSSSTEKNQTADAPAVKESVSAS